MTKKLGFILILCLFALGCKMTPTYNKATVRVFPTEGNTVSGVITFTKVNDGIKIEGLLSGLTPGKHGFHIHELGDLSFTNGNSSGGHFNPEGKKHNSPQVEDRHVGDLGNITADNDGKAVINMLDKKLSLSGNNCIIGRAIIVHEKEDDFVTQPTGNAGNRIGYGVIGISKE